MTVLHSVAMDCSSSEWAPDWERAIAYGDGVFETMRVHDGNIPLWSFHLSRLRHALDTLRIKVDYSCLESRCQLLAEQHKSGILKLTVARCGGSRGYDPRAAKNAAFNIQYFSAPIYSVSRLQAGVRLHLCRQRLSQNSALAGIKHLNRLEHVLAASEWNRDWAEEGLLLDLGGAVIEGTVSNIFIVRDGMLVTPQLSQCGVAGVMRALIMQHLAPEAGFSVREMRLTMADILAADECFICNGIFGIWPVQSIGVSAMPDVKKVSRVLLDRLQVYGYGALYV